MKPQDQINGCAQHAQEYAARGWYVFPLEKGTKHKHHLPNGHNGASSDPEQVAAERVNDFETAWFGL
jgi:hypothetical protein